MSRTISEQDWISAWDSMELSIIHQIEDAEKRSSEGTGCAIGYLQATLKNVRTNRYKLFRPEPEPEQAEYGGSAKPRRVEYEDDEEGEEIVTGYRGETVRETSKEQSYGFLIARIMVVKGKRSGKQQILDKFEYWNNGEKEEDEEMKEGYWTEDITAGTLYLSYNQVEIHDVDGDCFIMAVDN